MASYSLLSLKRSLKIGAYVFIVCLVLTQYLAYQHYRITRIEEIENIKNELNRVRDELLKTLNQGLSATSTLAFIVKKYGVPEDFDDVADDILNSNKHFDVLELTRKGIITHVYPLEGNEGIVGFDVLGDSLARVGAQKALEKRELFFAGPLELKQGGVAVIGRLPIFIEGEFFGFSVAIIKLSNLLNSVRTSEPRIDSIWLSTLNPLTKQEEFFPSDLPKKGLDQNAFISVEVPNGEWKLYLKRTPDFRPVYVSAGISLFGLILSVFTALFFYSRAEESSKLKKLVEINTQDLISSQDKLRVTLERVELEKYFSDSIINSLPGIFYMYNQSGEFIRWNKNFELVSGYSSEEITKIHPLDYFEGEEKELLKRKIASVFENGEDEVEAFFVTKNQKKIPYYFNGLRIRFGDQVYLLGVGIDLTEQKKIEHKLLDMYRERESTLNRITDAVVSFDRDWRYTFLNDAALASHPLGREKTIGKTLMEIHPDFIGSDLFKVYQDATKTMTVQEGETYYKTLDTWFSAKVYPTADGVTIFYRDISDRKKIEQETLKIVGRELHDSVVQTLVGAKMYLTLMKGTDTTDQHFHQAESLMNQAITEIRKLSHELLSPFSNGTNLSSAIDELMTHVSVGTGIQVITQTGAFSEGGLSLKFRTSLFRIVQEQVNNIVKHARAQAIHITLFRDEESIQLAIKDDGIGFDVGARHDGVGINNIKSRTAEFNGSIELISQSGSGTELKVRFPVSSFAIG